MMYEFGEIYIGKFVKRYKRFLVDFELDGKILTAFNPNTGSMKGLLNEGCELALSISSNDKRKFKYTVEGFRLDGHWVYTNTINVNRIVEWHLVNRKISELNFFNVVKREYKIGNSRIDFYLEGENEKAIVEVKNVTLLKEKTAMFPDAKTDRGKKHLLVLQKMCSKDFKSYLLYIVGVDGDDFECAKEIDPAYCEEFERAKKRGVIPLLYKHIFDPVKKVSFLKPLN